MVFQYSYAGSYDIPVNGRSHTLHAVVLGNRHVAFSSGNGSPHNPITPVYRSPSHDGIERVINLLDMKPSESEVLTDTLQRDSRNLVTLMGLREMDVARLFQEFIRSETGQTIPLDIILRKYATQVKRTYDGLRSHKPQQQQ